MELVQRLRQKGWKIELKDPASLQLNPEFSQRYPTLTPDHRVFLERVRSAVSPDEKAWLLCEDDYNGLSEVAFAWNCWEQMSLEAAEGDIELTQSVRNFWSADIPVLLSVKSHYAYLAIGADASNAGQILYGNEPEFEEATYFCESFTVMLEGLSGGGLVESSARTLALMV